MRPPRRITVTDPRAVKAFFAKPREQFEWVKKLKRDELEKELSGLDPPPSFHNKLMLHQKACFLIGVAFPQFLFLLDMGTGKTALVLELLRYHFRTGLLKRKVLVLCPTNVVVDTWSEQIEKHAPDLPFALLKGAGADKWAAFDELKSGLVICTYQGFLTMVSEKEEHKRKKRKVLVVQRRLVNLIAKNIEGLVLDESTAIKNKQSLWFRAARAVSKQTEVRYGMAGRAFGRDPLDLWAQFFLIDRGESLGPTLGLFRSAFYEQKAGHWTMFVYKFKQEMEDQLHRIMGHRSIRFSADECIDLPPITKIVRHIDLPEETEGYYRRIVAEVVAARGNLRAIKNAFLRMRQISSGFLGFRDSDTGDKAEIEFTENPKLDELMELLDEMPLDRKAVVVCEFTWSGRRICKALADAGIGHLWLWSGTSKNYAADKKRFESDPKLRVWVVNHRAAGYGANLQAANYIFFYESPVSAIDRDQTERRVRRTGQQHRVFQYDLVVRNTADERILAFHREGGDLWSSVVRDAKQRPNERGSAKSARK